MKIQKHLLLVLLAVPIAIGVICLIAFGSLLKWLDSGVNGTSKLEKQLTK